MRPAHSLFAEAHSTMVSVNCDVQQVDEKILIKAAWSFSGLDEGHDDDFQVKLRLCLVGPKALGTNDISGLAEGARKGRKALPHFAPSSRYANNALVLRELNDFC